MHNSLEKLQVYCPRAGCYNSSLPAPVKNHPYVTSAKGLSGWVGGQKMVRFAEVHNCIYADIDSYSKQMSQK